MIKKNLQREKNIKKGLSIKTNVAITTIVFMGILTFAIAVIGYKLYFDNVMESYRTYAKTVLEYAYRAAEEYSFGDMIRDRSMEEGYEALREELNEVKESSEIEYLYAIYFEDPDDMYSLHYAINTKTRAELDADDRPLSEIYTYMGKPVEAGGFADDTLRTLQQAVQNKERENGTLEGYSDTYGHMLNGYRVLYDSEDHAAGLICVEIDINRIHHGVHRYIRTVLLTALIITAIIILIYILNIKRYLTGPLEKIAASSDAFIKKMQMGTEPEQLSYQEVPIKSGKELQLLSDNVKSLADGVASYMVSLKTATAEKERIGAELSLATDIQAAMLPHIFPPFPNRSEFDIFASMDPAKEVGGDFYDYFLIDEDHLCMVIADVSGKGVPAALFMMASKILLQSVAMSGHSPAAILQKTNEIICSNNELEMFVTVWLGILEISSGKLTAANAGHEYPAVKDANGVFTLLKDKHGFVIGGMEGVKYMEYELTLSPGSKIFVYTDGVPEATNAQEELFGTERMLTALNRDTNASPEQLLKNIRTAVDAFVKDAEQFDDLTMLCIDYHGKV